VTGPFLDKTNRDQMFPTFGRRKLITLDSVSCLVAKMPSYVFLFKNGIPEDQIVDLRDDSAAVEEGLKTVSGLIRDLSLPRIGREFHTLEVRQENGEQVLKIEISATRSR